MECTIALNSVNKYIPLRRIVNGRGEDVKFSEVKEIILKVFPELKGKSFTLEYEDVWSELIEICDDFGLCAIANKPKVQKKLVVKIDEKNIVPNTNIFHLTTKCDECGMDPIVGVRYKCSVLDDYDVCEICEPKKVRQFPMLKIINPEQFAKLSASSQLFKNSFHIDVGSEEKNLSSEHQKEIGTESLNSQVPAADVQCGVKKNALDEISGEELLAHCVATSSLASGLDHKMLSRAIDKKIDERLAFHKKNVANEYHLAGLNSYKLMIENSLAVGDNKQDSNDLLNRAAVKMEAGESAEISTLLGGPETRIYIENIHVSIDESGLKSVVEQFGTTESIKLHRDNLGNSKGFAFVKYLRAESAALAMSTLGGLELAGRALKVGPVIDSKTTTSGGSGDSGMQMQDVYLSAVPETHQRVESEAEELHLRRATDLEANYSALLDNVSGSQLVSCSTVDNGPAEKALAMTESIFTIAPLDCGHTELCEHAVFSADYFLMRFPLPSPTYALSAEEFHRAKLSSSSSTESSPTPATRKRLEAAEAEQQYSFDNVSSFKPVSYSAADYYSGDEVNSLPSDSAHSSPEHATRKTLESVSEEQQSVDTPSCYDDTSCSDYVTVHKPASPPSAEDLPTTTTKDSLQAKWQWELSLLSSLGFTDRAILIELLETNITFPKDTLNWPLENTQREMQQLMAKLLLN